MTAKETEWTYIGQHLASNGKSLLDVWIDDAGELHAFNKFKGAGIGSRYVVTLDDAHVMTGGEHAPRYVGQSDHPDRGTWALDDRLTRTRLEMQRRAKRDATNPLSDLLAPLRAEYRSTIGTARRAALVAAIITEITG